MDSLEGPGWKIRTRTKNGNRDPIVFGMEGRLRKRAGMPELSRARGEEGPHSPSAGHLFSVVTGNEKTGNSRTSWSVFHLRFSLARPFPRLRRTALHLPTDPLTPDGGRGRRYRDVIPSLEGRLDHPFPPRLFPCLGEIEAGVELDVRPDSPGVDVVQS